MESPTTSSSSASDHRWKRGPCIGRGSFANVYIATNSHTTFAVKSTPLNSNSNQLNSLNNEIQILQKLHSNNSNPSPYVIQYLGNDTTSSQNGTIFRNLHLEYLQNGTISEQSNKTEHLIRSYTRCLVAALAHLHSLNIVHCDIKARNVLVAGKYGECKLADFGSAFEISSAKSSKIVPRGSPLWMAPEVLRGEYQGPESDVWSLGCTVIEMMTGEVNRGGGGGTIWRVAFEEKLPEIPAGVSEDGRDFLEKCLRRERKERWSCAELMKHPFVAEIGFDQSLTSLTWSNTPRCVLDEFDLNFNDMGSISGTETASFGFSLAIEKLCLCCDGGVAAWNDDEEGWMTVRRNITGYSDSVMEMDGNERVEEIEGSICDVEEIEGLKCKLGFRASTWMGNGSGCGSVCGYESKDVFGGLLLLCRLSFIMLLLLITNLFNNYWRILEKLLFINGGLLLVWVFLDLCTTKRFTRRNPNPSRISCFSKSNILLSKQHAYLKF